MEEPTLGELDKRSQDERVRDFSDLISKIENIDNKQKQLWKEIYENAITDRQNAYVMFIALAKISEDKSNEFAIHGRTIATFLERMSKANDQLIKLTELISRSDPANQPIDSDTMFEQISKRR